MVFGEGEQPNQQEVTPIPQKEMGLAGAQAIVDAVANGDQTYSPDNIQSAIVMVGINLIRTHPEQYSSYTDGGFDTISEFLIKDTPEGSLTLEIHRDILPEDKIGNVEKVLPSILSKDNSDQPAAYNPKQVGLVIHALEENPNEVFEINIPLTTNKAPSTETALGGIKTFQTVCRNLSGWDTIGVNKPISSSPLPSSPTSPTTTGK